MDILSLAYLIFLIPLGSGLILAIASAFGLADGHDHDFDHDIGHELGSDVGHDHALPAHDAGHDQDGEQDGEQDGNRQNTALDHQLVRHRRQPLWLQALTLIGLGRAPLSVIAMTSLLLFGGIGLCGNILVGTTVWPLTALLAGGATVFLTGIIARLFARCIPNMETTAMTAHQLCGQVGNVVLLGEGGKLWADVVDQHGTQHRIACAVQGPVPAKGSEIIVVSYDERDDRYQVEPVDFLPSSDGSGH